MQTFQLLFVLFNQTIVGPFLFSAKSLDKHIIFTKFAPKHKLKTLSLSLSLKLIKITTRYSVTRLVYLSESESGGLAFYELKLRYVWEENGWHKLKLKA